MRRVLVPAETSAALPFVDSTLVDVGGESMGTTWSVRLVADPGADPDWQRTWQAPIQQQLDAVVAEMSHWLVDSDLGRYNRAPAGSWQTLPDAFFEVLCYALSVAEESGGAYDPAAGALVNLWGFGPTAATNPRYDEPGFRIPDADAIDAARRLGGWQRISLDATTRKACQPGGLLLDLSAVAKGYSVDRVARYLESRGIVHYLVEVGGELRGAGVKTDYLPWWVALEQPPIFEATSGVTRHADQREDSEEHAAQDETIIALHGLSVATSGDYRRFYQADGRLCPHTIDPRSGHPVHNGIASVTVLHPSCMAADALSTALTVLGVENGMIFAEKHQLAARFLVRDGTGFSEHASRAFVAMLQ